MPTDLHEIPTRPFEVEVDDLEEEQKTKMTEVAPLPREDSTFDERGSTYTAHLPQKRSRAPWIAGAGILLFVLISLALAIDRDEAPPPKPISIAAPVMPAPPPIEVAPPPPIEVAPEPPPKIAKRPPAKSAIRKPTPKPKREKRLDRPVEEPPPPKQKAIQMPEW
jgi:hypothetical protein